MIILDNKIAGDITLINSILQIIKKNHFIKIMNDPIKGKNIKFKNKMKKYMYNAT